MMTIEVDLATFVKGYRMSPNEWQERNPGIEKDWGFGLRYANSRRHLGFFHVCSTWKGAEKKALDIAGRHMVPMVVEVLF